jgi:hypothetical protein
MQPRLNSSKQFSPLPAEALKMIESAVKKAFAKNLKGKVLVVDGRLYTAELWLRVGFREDAKAIRQKNFEASVDYSKTMNLTERLALALDAIGSILAAYFEDEDTQMPVTWTEFDFEKKPVYLIVTGDNPDLEDAADAILSNGKH